MKDCSNCKLKDMCKYSHMGKICDFYDKEKNDTKTIGLVGPMYGGKTTEAIRIVTNERKNGKKACVVSFADKLREFTWYILGFEPKNNEEYQNFKKTKFFSKELNVSFTGRQILQNVGKIFREKISYNFWVDELKKTILEKKEEGYKTIVIDDVRFENELHFLTSEMKAEIYFCNYNNQTPIFIVDDSEKLANKFLRDGYKHLDRVV
jgi:hypothetical protein